MIRYLQISLFIVETLLMTFLILIFSPFAIFAMDWYVDGIQSYVNKVLDKNVELGLCTKEEADKERF